MKHRTVNDYFKQHWPRLILFAAFTLGVSFFAPLKNFQLKWLIDSKSKQEALGYMGLVAILLVTIPPLVLPRRMNERLKATRDAFSLQMAGYTQQLKELLGGFEVIRSFLREDAYAALHQKAARKARESELGYQQSLPP